MLIIWMMIIYTSLKGNLAAGFVDIAKMMIGMDRGSCCKAFFINDFLSMMMESLFTNQSIPFSKADSQWWAQKWTGSQKLGQ